MKDQERPVFRDWLAAALVKHCQMRLFNKERDAETAKEAEELADLVRALWKRCWIMTYVPTPKQRLFHDSRKAQLRGSFSRNQGGKTTMELAEVLTWGFGEEPWSGRKIEKVGRTKWHPGMRFFIGAKDFANAGNETILPKLSELLPWEEIGFRQIKMSGKITHKLIAPPPYEFTIKLYSYEQEASKAEGATFHGGAFDEPPPRALYVACRRGLMRHGGPLIFAATPLEEPWMYQDIYAHPNAVHLEGPADLEKLKVTSHAIVKIGRNDNPHISEQQLAAYEATLDEEEKAARIHGEFLHLQGRVYKTFTRDRHVLDREKFFAEHKEWRDYPAFCVMDPHDRKPFAVGWGVVTPREEIVFIDEWPPFDFARQKTWKWSIAEYAHEVRERERLLWGGKEGAAIAWRIMDPNFGRTQKAGGGLTVEQMFAEEGLFFDTSVSDDIDAGHMVVKSFLHDERLFWLTGLPNFMLAMENYVWDDYRGKTDRAPKERPRDKHKDFADLVRYVCMSDPRYIGVSAMTAQQNPWKGSSLG